MPNRKFLRSISIALLAAGTLVGGSAFATDPLASALGTTLTEFGANPKASEDGMVPAYTGGLTKAPAGFHEGANLYVDPYANEKPIYVVTAQNLDKYKKYLTAGTLAIFARYPDYKVEVYPSHRPVWYPKWILENTLKNAASAKIVYTNGKQSLGGGDADGLPFAGVPFPIPKNGSEVMWNHKFAVGPAVQHLSCNAWLVNNGLEVPLPHVREYFLHPWYDQSGALRKEAFNAIFGFSARETSPPTAAGITFLNYYLASSENGGQKVWFYTPGQRRVRIAPDFAYDTPISAYGGVITFDEVFGFVGNLNRFDYKLVGKKEMIVPYDDYHVVNMPSKETLGKQFVNPDSVRWEMHRVWVVEAFRKPGVHNIYSRRTYYVDEDSWAITSVDEYDNNGKIWRVGDIYTYPTYDTGGISNLAFSYMDLSKGDYSIINIGGGDPGDFRKSYTSGAGLHMLLTPQAVGAGNVR
ncbi:DUF1329 domain-containing protein [Acidocella sp.]|uniref:DUF1329 domain-containing protein n=1 Tax=Acidocella sp. TaxID=50710 RepID=UPI00261AC725|nr:DUF1329 domain-containing protein [Acidocella sp.]